MSSASRGVLFPSSAFLMYFISLPGVTALAKTPRTMLGKSGENGHHGAEGNESVFSPVTLLLAVGPLDDFQQVEVI